MRRDFSFVRRAAGAGLLVLATAMSAFAGQLEPIDTEVYRIDFETGLDPVVIISNAATITEDPSEVIGGTRSLKLHGPGATIALRPDLFPLVPSRVYVVEYRYRALTAGASMALGVGFYRTAPSGERFYIPLRGPVSPAQNVSTDRRSAMAGAANDTFLFHVWDRDIVIDEIRIMLHDAAAAAPAPAMITNAFPRLANYQLLAPDTIALINDVDQDQVFDLSSRFDLMMGTNFDHTIGAASWTGRLREKNPRLRILPYKQAFMAQFEGGIEGSGLVADFNNGLQPNWYLRGPAGNALNEPSFPQNVQLKHTIFGTSNEGPQVHEYTASFLADSVLATGLWAGIHFDQPEWYINPLLGDPAPAIDLDDDGTAEPTAVVQWAWARGFVDYFMTMARRLGPSTLLYGNAGHIPGNPTMLPLLNGWQGEVISPYPIVAGGEWNTAEPSLWYRLFDNYRLATTYARAPQIVSLQFTGRELGTQTGSLTPNGYPQRAPQLEWRDYRRMRLGLTTALMGNGFFEYDFVDNTTVPVWFDEYAVNASGAATSALSGKGYLGQPLDVAQELPYAYRTVFALDFESAAMPPGVVLGAGRLTTAPAEVIGGTTSFVATKTDMNDGQQLFRADLALEPGKTYQLFADYRILGYQPTTFAGLFGVGFKGEDGTLQPGRAASLFLPDTDGPGQQGTLRAVLKASRSDIAIVGGMTDTGSIALDNVRLLEATGNVWRREFENGIVLVNPTPEPLYVPQADIAGTRNRSGIKRILGSQVPAWNSGEAVTAGIWIGSGDGIVLLADRVPAAMPALPAAPVTLIDASGVTLAWAQGPTPVAGYLVRYGENAANLTRSVAAGPTAWIRLEELTPGTTYLARLTAHDFLGNEGPAREVTFTTAGTQPVRPMFALSTQTPALSAGGLVYLEGSHLADAEATASGALPLELAGTTVHVNGVAAALMSVAPNVVAFITPWQVTGNDAVVVVTRGGVRGAEIRASIVAARPWLLTWPGGPISIATHESGALLTATEPATAGGVIDLLSVGLGAVLPYPTSGQAAGPHPSQVSSPIDVRIGGTAAEVIGAWLLPNNAALYGIRVRVPAGLAPGLQPVDVSVGGVAGNSAQIPVN